jgi:hypothetical protein
MRQPLPRFHTRNRLSYMQMRECVEKQYGEADDYRNDSEPDEDKRSFILSGWRSGNPEHQGESTKYVSQKFDHRYSD